METGLYRFACSVSVVKNLLLSGRITAIEAVSALADMCCGVNGGDLMYVKGYNRVADALLAKCPPLELWMPFGPGNVPSGQHVIEGTGDKADNQSTNELEAELVFTPLDRFAAGVASVAWLLSERRITADEAAEVLIRMAEGASDHVEQYYEGWNPVVDHLWAWLDENVPDGQRAGARRQRYIRLLESWSPDEEVDNLQNGGTEQEDHEARQCQEGEGKE